MKKLFIFIFLLTELVFYGQEKIVLTLYFKPTRSEPDQRARLKLDSVARRLKNSRSSYEVLVEGHTDSDGNLEYNRWLSQRRASNVKKHLQGLGFDGGKINTGAFAYLKPSANNGDETGKTKNRRVTVTISPTTYNAARVLGHVPRSVTYTFNANNEAHFVYPSGSKINVPANAFIDEEGNAAKGKIKVNYTEYRNKLDFMTCGIPMSFHNAGGDFVQFNSAGMFKIEAYEGGSKKKLKLRPGSNIALQFSKTQELRDMGLYKFNEKEKSWTLKNENRIPVQNSVSNLKNSYDFGYYTRMMTNTLRNRDVCLLDSCMGLDFAIGTGLRLASHPSAIFISKAALHFKRTWKGQIPEYKMQMVSQKKNKVVFRIIPLHVAPPFNEIKEYQWEYNSSGNAPFKEEWTQTSWLKIKLVPMGSNDFHLALIRNSQKLSILLKAQKLHDNKNKTEYFDKGSGGKPLLSMDESYNDPEFLKAEELTPDGRVSGDNCGDSLFCFYIWSKQWMKDSLGESGMSFRQWFDFFNEHKQMMMERYAALNQQRSSYTGGCRDYVIRLRRERAARDSARYAAHEFQRNVVGSLPEQLSIPDMGIWNCDQVYRLQEPVYVKKTYRDKTGKTIDPACIYVIDPKVNGILSYGGASEMGPYNFPVSSSAQNTILAFDNSNKVYLCLPEDLRSAIRKNDKNIVLQAVPQNELAGTIARWVQ